MQTIRLQIVRGLLPRRVSRHENLRDQDAHVVRERRRRHVLASARFSTRQDPTKPLHSHGRDQIRRTHLVLRGSPAHRLQLPVPHSKRILAACTQRMPTIDEQWRRNSSVCVQSKQQTQIVVVANHARVFSSRLIPTTTL